MIFDLGVKDSFNDIKSYWINEVESYTDQGAVLVLVGNKSDGHRAVDLEQIESFVKEKNLMYFETSAANGSNVKTMFMDVAGQLSERGHKQKVGPPSINTPTTKLTT
jgi:GTPase SAR1 family protein